MSFRELESVVLEHDIPEHGLRKGDLGAIVFVHDSGAVEVEFVRASGHTQAVLQLEPTELRAAGDEDVPAVRPAD